jgi:hypothetical protein
MFRGTRDAGVVAEPPTVRRTAPLTPPTPILPTRTQAVAVKRDVRVKADWSIGSPENTVSADAATPRARRDENRIRFKRTRAIRDEPIASRIAPANASPTAPD